MVVFYPNVYHALHFSGVIWWIAIRKVEMAPRNWTILHCILVLNVCICKAADGRKSKSINTPSLGSSLKNVVSVMRAIKNKCPSDCSCQFTEEKCLSVSNCTITLRHQLTGLLNMFPDAKQLKISLSEVSLIEEVFNLTQLTSLHLQIDNMMSMPCELSGLTKLTLLDLSHNYIEAVSCDLSNLVNLTTFDLSHNGLKSMPCDLTDLTNLSLLNMSHNSIASVRCDLSNLTALKTLDLSYNYLKVLPCQVSVLNQLSSLDLSHNFINSDVPILFPDLDSMYSGPCNFHQLKYLDLSYNHMKSVPDELSSMINLTHLDLSQNRKMSYTLFSSYNARFNNDLANISCELSNLTKLTYLDLSNNYIYSFRCDFPDLIHLTALDLSYNGLSSMPCELSNLTKLIYLDLSNNDIYSITCDLTDLIQLTTLDLSHNDLWSVPCELSKLSNLTFLDLSQNRIHSVSCGLSTTLVSLDLAYNRIGSSPLDLSNLTQLTFIDLERNSIESIDSWPISLANGNSNIDIYLTDNRLSEFTNNGGAPVTECSSNNLQSVSLNGNGIQHFTNILTGWNINISTPELLHSCLDILDLDMVLQSLTCDCVDYEVYRYFQNRSTYNDQLVCDQPPHLRNRNIMSINLDQFICDIHTDSCPQGCQCKSHPYYKSINVSCKKDYKGGTLPTILPELPNKEYSYCLDFEDTRIVRIQWTPYLAKVKVAKFSYSWVSEISMEALWDLQNISTLNLEGNKLHRLPDNVTAIRFNRLSEIRLGRNPWDCDCAATETRRWMILHKNVIKDRDIMQCDSPSHMLHVNMIYNTSDIRCPSKTNKNNNVIIGSISGTIVLLVCILITIVIKIRKWLHTRKLKQNMDYIDDVEDREFDVFISFASEDEDYIVDTLMPELENHNYKVCFHRIHFLGGFTLSDNIFQCINNSRRTLVYFSNFYKNSNCCMWEFNEALNKDIQEGTKCLITIKAADLDTENMDGSLKAYFQRRTHIERDGPKFWENLLYSLPKRHAGPEVFEIQED